MHSPSVALHRTKLFVDNKARGQVVKGLKSFNINCDNTTYSDHCGTTGVLEIVRTLWGEKNNCQ